MAIDTETCESFVHVQKMLTSLNIFKTRRVRVIMLLGFVDDSEKDLFRCVLFAGFH